MSFVPDIAILGGGPAGLAVGYYAQKSGQPFHLYEGQDRVGGNCITLHHGDFRFDSGAHRLHDKDRQATEDIKQLLGDDLRMIEVPSQIWHEGRLYDFPIAPFNLLKTMGPFHFAKAGMALLQGRLRAKSSQASFQDFALRAYGKDIASRFLLNYSEKLWGAPCDHLSPAICGARLKGLGLTSLVIESLFGKRANTRHLDGAFYYPRQGYGVIVEKLAEACGFENISLNARVTELQHSGNRINSISVNGSDQVPVDEVACTLPISTVMRCLNPAPPAELVAIAKELRYRNVILVAVFISRNQISGNGSMYFPDPGFPFTRVYEPKNRSSEMAPAGCTSLVAEIPCQPTDDVWTADPSTLIETVIERFVDLGWFKRSEVLGSTTHRLPHAYPILELGYEAKLKPILDYLGTFSNLSLAGRNGCFVYSHLHDMMRSGREIVSRYSQNGTARRSQIQQEAV